MFASPTFLVGSTLATLWAALFHLLLGKRWSDLVLSWFIALIGFGVGQAVAQTVGTEWMVVGELHLIEGTFICWLAMLIARWLRM
jgi:hypothetical protein